MNLFGKLQSEYEQLWKYIIRPTRTPYSEDNLGPNIFKLENQEVVRKDFQLTNSRGYTFQGSIWLPTLFDKYNCIVYLHGNSGNRTDGMEYLGKIIKNNLAICTFDFSGCGNAEGEYVTLGYYEQQDLKLVIDHLKTLDYINYLAVWGRSMGAVTTMLYLNKTIQIKGVVFDSPFKSLKCLIQDMAKKNTKVPSFVLTGAIKIISKTVEDKANFSIYNVNPLKYSVPGLYCPAFFIVAIEDQIVSCEHTKELYAAYGGEDKQLKLVKGKHNDPRPEQCVNDAVNFLLDKFGHDWKDTLKKQTKKQFDFFEMEKLQQKQREQHKKQEVNFFAQNTQEVQQVEQNIKKGQFSLSGLFSIFSRDNKKKDKEKEKEKQKDRKQPVKDGYQQTRSILLKKNTNMIATKQQVTQKKQRQKLQQKMKKQVSQQNAQNNLSEWVTFYI